MAAADIEENKAHVQVVVDSSTVAGKTPDETEKSRKPKAKKPKEIDPNTISKLDTNNVVNAVQVLLKVLEETKNEKPSLVEENTSIQLQYSFKKIPQIKNKRIHVRVPHSTVTDNTDICLFVKDVHKGAEDQEDKRDFQPSVRHFRKIVEDAGVLKVEEIMPIIQLKREFRDFETQKKLSDSYDLFLCDDRISKFLPKLLGKHFVQKRKQPINVKLDSQEAASKSLKKALHSVHGFISGKGSSSSLTVAHTGLTSHQITDNLVAAVSHVTAVIPGGWSNIRNLHVTTTKSTSIPLYVSTESGDRVDLPPDVIKERQMIASGDPGLIGDEEDDGLVQVFDDGTIRFAGDEEEEEGAKDNPPRSGRKASYPAKKGNSAPADKTLNGSSVKPEQSKGNEMAKKNGKKPAVNGVTSSVGDCSTKRSSDDVDEVTQSPAKEKAPPAKKTRVAATKGPLSKKPRLA